VNCWFLPEENMSGTRILIGTFSPVATYVCGLSFMVSGSGFMVWGSGIKFWALALIV